jgi:glycosyltransferase involved in cell wall biosynthesis
MKVLHVISGDLWAGAEAQACTLLTSLQKEPGVEVAAALLNEGELARRLRAHGIPVTLFAERESGPVQIVCGLRKLIREWRPDVVHTHRFKENILGSVANLLSRNVPSVRTVHGASEHAASSVTKRTLRYLDVLCGRHLQQRIIAVSADLAQKLARDFPDDKIAVIENGVDVEAVRSQAAPVAFRTAEPAATHVGIVGRLVPVKRVDLFLDVARTLRVRDPARTWQFHVFGDGPLRASLVASTDGQERITFHGHRDDSIACIAGLDVLVMCSDHEGLPMTLLEALAVGTRIVAHGIGGIPSVLGSRPDCRVVTQHDADGYAAAILDLLASTGRAQHPLADGAVFTARNNAQRIGSLYRELASEHAA